MELLARVVLVLINSFGLLIAWWVLQSGSKLAMKRWFLFMTLFMLMWANFSYFGSRVDNHEIAVLFYRLNWAVVSLFLVAFYYFFAVHFLDPGRFTRYIGFAVMFSSIMFFLLSIFTNEIILDVTERSWGNEVVFGNLGNFFSGYSAIVAILILVYGIRSFLSATSDMRRKLLVFLLGIVIFVIANLVFNVASQVLFNSVQYQFLGDFSSIILLVFTAYSTIQHKLFDVKVAATEAITTFLVAILFSRILVSQSDAERIIDLIVFLLALAFGYLLVKSVNREIEQRKLLEELNQKLEGLDKQKDEFLNVASHELRAPMTAVKGYLSMLQNGDGGEIPAEAREYLSEAIDETERMIRLINNMLDVSRIEEGRMVFERGVVKLSDVVRRVYNEFSYDANVKKLGYVFVPQPSINDRVVVDVDRIHEVVANLINNAIKYTDEGKVVVKLSNPSEGIVRFEVQDTGPGMTIEELSKLFSKFYRTESYVGKKIGTGLGLYISKLLVEKFGGKIGVESEKDKGSIFWFELPVNK